MACGTSADVKSREQLAPPSTTRQIPCLRIGIFVNENRRLLRRSRHRCVRVDQKLLTSHLLHEIVFAGREPTATLPKSGALCPDQPPKQRVRRNLQQIAQASCAFQIATEIRE
jgi:hypothetical protein